MDVYYVRGINNMGSTWYMHTKGANGATLWSGAPKDMRAIYSKDEADAEIERLDNIYQFGSTRHYREKVG